MGALAEGLVRGLQTSLLAAGAAAALLLLPAAPASADRMMEFPLAKVIQMLTVYCCSVSMCM